MNMIRAALPLLILVVCAAGCVRRDGLNSDCKWLGEADDAGVRRHLSKDAELAEELAIRYADTHHGLRWGHFESWDVYARARNQCLSSMFEEIGKVHGVTARQVFETLGGNRAEVDLAVNLPFLALYGLVAGLMILRLWARYPPSDGWLAGVMVVLLCSIAFGVGGVLLGEAWSNGVESARIGNGHLSYRVDRLPWARYRAELFTLLVILFWCIAAVIGWRRRPVGREADLISS